MKSIAYFGALVTLVIMTAPADARDRRERRDESRSGPTCQKIIKERGDRAYTRAGAVANARTAWVIAAKNAHGVDYAHIDKAWTDPDARVENPSCFADPERFAKKWECTYTAKPCLR